MIDCVESTDGHMRIVLKGWMGAKAKLDRLIDIYLSGATLEEEEEYEDNEESEAAEAAEAADESHVWSE